MSEILDALKKLDREKAARRNATADIAVEILAAGLPRPGRRLRQYIAVVCFTAVVAAAITYAVVVMLRVPPESVPSARVNTPPPAQQVPSVSMEPAVPTKSAPSAKIRPPAASQQAPRAPRETDIPSESPSPVRVSPPPPAQEVSPAPVEPAVQAEATPLPPQAAPAAHSETSPVPAKVQKPAEKEAGPPAIQAPPATPDVAPGTGKTIAEPSPAGTAVTPSSFKITVIVWDEDPSKRWAMINGMKAAQGSVIGGVKVEEIHLTGVRFFHNGRSFEISID